MFHPIEVVCELGQTQGVCALLFELSPDVFRNRGLLLTLAARWALWDHADGWWLVEGGLRRLPMTVLSASYRFRAFPTDRAFVGACFNKLFGALKNWQAFW